MTTETEKSPREIAKEILDKCARRQIAPPEWGTPTKWVTEFDETRLANEIDKALRDRDERAAAIAAKKAETLRRAAHVVQQPTEEALRMAELAINTADDIASAIRGKS
jgi:hypothetical protein